MSDLTQQTAAPSTITIKGQTYKLSPLTFADFGRLVQAVRDSIIESAAHAIGHIEDPADKRLVMQEAYAAAKRVTFATRSGQMVETSPEVTQFMESPDGALLLLHMSLKRRQKISYQETAELASHVSDLQAAVEQVMRISGFGSDAEADNASEGTEARKSGPKSQADN